MHAEKKKNESVRSLWTCEFCYTAVAAISKMHRFMCRMRSCLYLSLPWVHAHSHFFFAHTDNSAPIFPNSPYTTSMKLRERHSRFKMRTCQRHASALGLPWGVLSPGYKAEIAKSQQAVFQNNNMSWEPERFYCQLRVTGMDGRLTSCWLSLDPTG